VDSFPIPTRELAPDTMRLTQMDAELCHSARLVTFNLSDLDA
jgi:hypothetical protein